MLVADDHPEIVKAISRLLALDCEVVGTATDGGDVLGAAQRLRPDVVVVDLNLPTITVSRCAGRSNKRRRRPKSSCSRR